MNDKNRANKRSPLPPSGPIKEAEMIKIGDYVAVVLERWFLSLTLALLVSCSIGYYLMSRPPVYRSEAVLFIDAQGSNILEYSPVLGSEMDSRNWQVGLENHMHQLTSRSFRNYVIGSLTLEEKERITAPYFSGIEGDPPPSIGGILSGIEVNNPRGSHLLRIRMYHRDRVMAALIADRYAESYIHFNKDRREAGNIVGMQFLGDQAEDLRRKAERAEQAQQEYRQKNNLVSVQDNQNLIGQRLRDISSSLTNARLERLDLEGRIRQVEAFQESEENLLEFREISSLGSTPQIINRVDQLRQEREVMKERYGARHPEMINNERAIAAAEDLIRSNINLAIADLRGRLRLAQEREDSLLTELKETERESLDLDHLIIEYRDLQRAAERARASYEQIVERFHEIMISSQLDDSRIRVADQAVIPSAAVAPDPMKIGMLALFVGGFFFVAIPIGLNLVNTKLKGASEVEEFLGQKLLGEITSLRKRKKMVLARIVEQNLDDRTAEAFRGIYCQLQLDSKKKFPKSLMVTSTLPGEGKSFVTSNLGFCFSANRKRTLLIDFDLRRPGLHSLYNLPNDRGILYWLKKDCPAEGDCVAHNKALGIVSIAPNLFLLRAGGQTKKATEAINDPGVGILLTRLKREFEVLMIDTPPLGIFPDALSLGCIADESLYVTRFGKVDRNYVKRVLGRLEETDARLLGVVLNGMPKGKRSSYSSSYGYGNYEYAKYYAQQR